MTALPEAQTPVGKSANILSNRPTIAPLAAHLAELLAPCEVPEQGTADLALDLAGSESGF
jgi:hypothetical protein